jgi:hypothetical protein
VKLCAAGSAEEGKLAFVPPRGYEQNFWLPA